ncbi:nickel ABC transporter, nickel/metallophore periplasmic binding protein [Helicobacter cinaedi]|uniref:nickel ABC transporter substrate-binding protein n=1 Tax=Helicobacter cinaedi TaxID=213 RepID=UPI001EEDBCC4|nr:nickel ABC transporter substrate-binding protein [Helicobacter cinaedi]BDB65024.1 nickel ABC transporter, nickel/metallophore periplasmic binding protein [Helicobacter cinaedi]
MRGYVVKILCLVSFTLGTLYGKNTLIMAVSSNIGVMNPQGYQGNAMFAQNSIYESLVSVDKNGRIIPHLATSWQISKDGLSYTFILRKGVKFSNGEAFNADAVLINFNSVLKNKVRHSWSGLVSHIESVKKLDDYSIKLTLKAPYSPTLNELAVVRPFRFLAPSAFPKDLDLIKYNPKPIGTGAYMLVDSKLGISDTLQKNPHYWDAERYNGIYYDEIVLKVIFDPNAKLAALKSGQIDLIYGNDQIPLEIFKSMQNDKKFATYMSLPLSTTSLVFNSSSHNLKLGDFTLNQKLRKGLGSMIDKQKLVLALYGGLQGVAECFMSCEYQANKTGQGNGADSKAFVLSLLNKENIPSGVNLAVLENLTQKGIEILFSGDNPAHKMMAEIAQSDLQKAGIKVRLKASEPSIYQNRLLKGQFDLAFGETWGAPYEPLSVLHSMLVPGHIDFSAQSGLENKPLLEKALRDVIATNTESKDFKSKLSKVLDMLEESGVYLPLTLQKNKAIAHKKIKGIQMGVVGYEVPFWEMYE